MFIPTPNLILKTLSSLGVKVDKILVVASPRLDLIACSSGAKAFVSSIKSPKLLSSSSAASDVYKRQAPTTPAMSMQYSTIELTAQ